jgi:hypothetical protein
VDLSGGVVMMVFFGRDILKLRATDILKALDVIE